MDVPRFMITACGSGSGKTLLTCGILQMLKNRGEKTAAFKCGPDYIDPMFHSKVIGSKSRNLDSFFTGEETLKYLLLKNAKECDIAVLEGVMGYYDGIAGTTTRASAYEIASMTGTPAILVINAKGMSLSAAAIVAGFLGFRESSQIAGVILNQISPMFYERLKEQIEQETGVRVYGYVPPVEDCLLESRHLGLLMPDEIKGLREKIQRLADVMENSIDMEGLIKLAKEAPPINAEVSDVTERVKELQQKYQGKNMSVAVARDEAFCFFYEDNLALLKDAGVEIVEFSPLHGEAIPAGVCGLMLNGGYPELYAEKLSRNEAMKASVKCAVEKGVPIIAECGGFLYLHEELEGSDGRFYPMVGVVRARACRTKKLSRFGYVTLSGGRAFGKEVGDLPAHEFHYYDSAQSGNSFLAKKPKSNRNWACVHAGEHTLLGFPHYYFYGNLSLLDAYLSDCLNYKEDISYRQNKE